MVFLIGILVSFIRFFYQKEEKDLVLDQVIKQNSFDLLISMYRIIDLIENFSQNQVKSKLYNLIFQHQAYCQDDKCLCHQIEDFSLKHENHDQIFIVILNFFKQIFRQLIEKHPQL